MHSRLKRASAPIALVAVLLLAAQASGRDGTDTTDSIEAGKKLLAEGDALADKGDTTEAVVLYKQAFEKLLPSLRKLAFKTEVKRDVTARENLKDVILQEIERDMTPEEFKAGEAGMKALGLLPRDTDLKSLLVQLYAEEIAAFYDPRTDTMHLIREPETGGRQPSFFERLLGKTGGFDKDENKTIIAHEMTHALADQHHDLKAMQEEIQEDDDRQLALSALIEGEATLAMTGAQMEDWKGTLTTELPAEDLGRIFGMVGPLLPAFGGKQLQGAPPILRESMLFPYIKGLVFCASLTNSGKWEAVNKAFDEPPLSTEQVLHPEKYRRSPDEPRDFDLSSIETPEGWTLLGRNVLGEMQTAVLLRLKRGRQAAEGWDGDRFAVYENADKTLGLVWRSVWDTEADAREFAESYARFATAKLEAGEEIPEPVPARLLREGNGVAFLIERRGADVAIVEGFSRDTTEALAEKALGLEAKPKTRRPIPPVPGPETPRSTEPKD